MSETISFNAPVTESVDAQKKTSVVFIDARVEDSTRLLRGIDPHAEVVLLQAGQGGLRQMADFLSGHAGLDSIQIVAHGSQGKLWLGSSMLETESLAEHKDLLATIGQSLTDSGDILIYSCNTAAGAEGYAFVSTLAEFTGADVAASNDYTGAADSGGNWTLEVQTGAIESASLGAAPGMAGYSHLLAITDSNFDSGSLVQNDNVASATYDGWEFGITSGTTDFANGNFGETGTYMNQGGGRSIVANYQGDPGVSSYYMKSADGTNFQMLSFSLTNVGGGASSSLTIAGYRDGNLIVAAEAVNLASSDSAGNITYTYQADDGSGLYWGTLSFNASFNNIDELRFLFTGDAQLGIDDIDISPAASAAAVSSATYNASTGVLAVTGSGMTTGDTIDPTKLTVTGSNGGTYTLTSSSVTASSATAFSITLNAADKVAVNGLWNYDGTTAVNGTTYNLSAASGWDATASALADTTNGVTVSNVASPTITSATYDASTNVLVVTGTRLVGQPGSTNDITVSNLRLRGEGGTTHTLTTGNVDVTSETSFSVTLNATDEAAVELLFNRNGTTSTDISTYTLSALDYWNTDVNDGGMADSNNVVTVSNVPVPAITSATYNASTGVLAVTGTGFTTRSGTNNDIEVTKLSLSGEGGASYTLTTSNVEITNGTSFSVTLNATDRAAVNLFMNRSGTSSTSGTTYNLAAAEDWAGGAATAVTVADTTGNGVTATVPAPTITSATYNAATGTLVVTGTGFLNLAGAANDIDISKLTISGDSSAYTLTSSNVDVTSSTSFTVTLNSTDIAALTTRLNQNGTSSVGANTYNLAAAEDWAAGAAAAVTVADITGNGITVSNFVNAPTVGVVVADNALSVGESSLVTFTFSEAVTGFDNSDVSVANGTLSTVSSSDGGVTWTATLTPTTSVTDASNVIGVAMSGVTSVATSTAGSGTTNSNNYAIDTLRPTLTSVTLNNTALRIGDTATVTFTFSEAVSNFSTADLTSPNGSLTSLSSSDGGTTWTATFTPSASTTAASNVITLDLTGITDTADNAGTSTATSGKYAVDTQRPTASIVVADTKLAVGETSLVTITFSEAVDNFINADLTIANGTLSAVSSSDGGTTWSATLTPTTDIEDTSNVITLDNTGVTDKAGNAGSGSTNSNNYQIDTKLPTATITVTDTSLIVGETSAVTITFSEAVDNFDNADLTIANGTLSSVSSSDGGTTWTATLTPTASVEDSSNVITLDNTGITDKAGNAGSGTTNSNNYAIDTSPPVAPSTPDMTAGTDTGDANNDDITGDNTPTFNGTGEVGATVNLYDTDGSTSLGSATVNGSGKWSITTSSMAHGVHSLTLKSTDVAGNVSSASGALSISVVTTAPTVSSVAYNERTGVLTVTGTNFVALSSGNDIDASMLTFTGEGGTYTLTDTSDVELSSATSFSLTLSATDQAGIQQILNKNGTTSFSGTTYQLNLAEGWDAGIAGTITSSIAGKAVTASGIATISSANYTAHGSGPIAAGTLTVTGANLNTSADTIDPSKLTLQVLNGSTVVDSYTLTTAYNPSTVTVDSTTQFSVVLNATDQLFINGLLNNAGTTSIDGYDFNLNAAAGWNTSFSHAPDKYVSTPALTNSVNVDDAASPAITSATFNTITHVLSVTGTDMVAFSGSNNDVTIAGLTFTGAGSKTYTLTSTDVDVTSATSFAVTLNATDQTALAALLDKDGTKATDNTTYNLSAAINWNGQVATVADTTNALTVTTPAPTVSKVIQTSGNGGYKAGDTITVKVSFDQAVVVDDSGGTPRILLETGATDEYATYVSGSGSADLVFSYTVQAGDTSSDLQYWDTASFDLNSATIVSVANGATADLTLPGTSSGNSLAETSALVIDTTPPATPATPDLDSASDSGRSSSDDYTSDNTPTFSGTADANTTVRLYDTDGVTALGSTTSDGSGNWSITAASMSDGSHTVTVKAQDAVGNLSSASSSLSVAIDTAAPGTTVSTVAFSDDTGSSSSDFVTSTAKQDVSGTLSANLASNETVQVSFDNGASWIDASATVGENTFSLTKQTLSGVDTLKVRLIDDAGNVGTVKSQAYTIDTSVPSAPSTPDLIAGSDSGASSTDDETSDSTPTFSGTAEANATVTLYDTDGITVLGATTADGSGAWSITTSTLSEGTHTVSVKATDTAGNVSSASSTLSVTIDATAPTTTVATLGFSSDTGSSNADFITKTAAQTISGTLSANLASGETVQVSLDNGATWVDASATVGQNTFSLTGQTLTASDTLKVRVMDTAGNAGAVKSQAYELDTSAPTNTISSLAFSKDTGTSSSDFITNVAAQTLSGTLPANLAAGETVQISLDNGSTWVDASATLGQNTFSLSGQTLTGSDTLKARVVDTAGNAGTVQSQAYGLDTTAPSTTVATLAFSNDTGVSGTDFITNAASQTLSGTLSANLASGETVQISLDNGATWVDASATVGQNTFSLTGQTLSASDTLKARVVDTAGNAGTVKSQAYVLDTTAPSTTIASVAFSNDTGVSSSDFITSAASQDISGTLSANLASGESVQISLDNGSTWQDASTTVGKNTFSLTSQTISGSDTLKLRVVDEAGNTGTVDSHAYILDTSAPSTATVKLGTSSLKVGSTAKVTITFSEAVGNFDNSDVTVANGTLSTLSSSDGGLTWTGTFTPTNGITDATNVITIDKSTLTDLAGNAGSGTTNSSNYKIDTQRPTVNITMADSALKIGDTATVTFTFSEAVSGFTNADLLIDNGTMSAVTSSDGGTTWTATFTPKANIEDASNLITIDLSGVSDAFGNAGSGAHDSANYTVDTKRPTVTVTMDDSKLGIGETATVTFTFSESVSGFTTADVLADNGTLSNLSSADGGTTWTATFTPDKGVTSATNVITVDNIGVIDAAGNTGTGTTDSANYQIDAQRPTATITLDDTALKIGDTAKATITFSEAVSGLTNADLIIANGTLSSVSSSDGGITWTATFTPSANLEDATNVITLDNSGVADAFGNAGSGTTDSNNYAIDTQRPTATVTLDDTALKVGDTAKATITFSEAVSGLTNADLTIANGTLSSVSSSDGGITWTATFTPSANINDATNLVTLDNSGVTDLAGNAGTGSTDSNNYAIDTQRPTATISLNDSKLGIGEVATVTFTFSESVSGFTTVDVLANNGTLSNLSSADGGTTWTATFTPDKGVTSETNVITVDNSGVTDAAGNTGTGTTDSANYQIDTQRPTATITLDDTALKIGDTAKATITFSEAVSGLTNADLTITNGTLSSVSSSDGGVTWTATFTPSATLEDATNVITLDNSGVADAFGNAGSGTTDSNNYAIDTKRPTATITLDDTALKVGDTAKATITFSEAVSGLTNADLTIANGTLSSVSSSDGGITWTATFTPSANINDATNLVTLDNSGVTDLAGNAGTGSTDSNNYAIDTQRPTATISLNDSKLGIGEVATVTFTFSESVSGFTTVDVLANNGTLSNLSSADGGTTWTATFTPDKGVTSATNLITVDNTGVADAAGNTGTGTTDSANYAIDTQRPTATISLDDTALKIGDTAKATITFSEAVSGLTNADLTIANGTLSSVSSSDGGITWTATFTPSANLEDATNVITLDKSGVADAFGNAGSGTTDSNNYAIDTKRPTATITLDDTALKVGDTSTVTFTFSEAVTGFTNADLTVANGTLSSVSSKDGGVTWTGTFTPTSGIEDASNVITLDNTGVSDLAGNAGSGTTNSNNYATDTKRPTATISIADSKLSSGETTTVTFTFSEAVSGFTTADLAVANGTIAGLSSSDGGMTWTATLTPNDNIEDATNVITLDNTGVTDAAGNAGTGSTDSANYAIDAQRPTATITLDDTAFKIGDTAKATITFSEAVSGLTNADLTIANGTLSSVSSSDGGITWTATFTPSANLEDATNVITLDNTGVTDAAGNAGTGSTDSANYAIDAQRPTATITLDDTALKVGDTAKATITFSEAVSGLTNADLTIANGTLSSVSSSDGGITWTATFTPSANINDATNLVTLDNSGVTDLAGNAGTGSTDSNNYAIDTQRPTATISLNDSKLGIGEVATVTFTFSESVSGFTTVDVLANNGTLSNLSSADGGTTWTATFTPDKGVTSATNVITVDNSGVTDAAGNTGTGTTDSANYAIDTQRPTATITLDHTALKIGDTAKATITFSEAVSGLTNADLTIANGTLSSVSSSDGGITWTATFTPSADLEDATNVITLDNSGVADAFGNAGSGTTDSNNYAIDTQRPTAIISLDDTALKVGDTSTVTITFSEAVTGLTAADLLVANGAVTNLASNDGGETWLGTFTPNSPVEDASNVITLDNTGVADLAGNAGSGTADSANYAIDTQRPTATISLDDTALKIGDTSTVTFTFSEAVTGFTNADLTVANGTLSAVSSKDGGVTWTGTFTPTSDLEDATNVITLDNTGVADLAGNAGSGTTDSSNYSIDTKRPTATISLDDTAFKIGDTSTVTLTFSEAVAGLTNADLTIANGTLSAVSSKDGGVTWTGTFTPTSDLDDATNLITLDNAGVQDAAGNAGSGTTDSGNYSIDSQRPTATISLDDTALKVGDTSTVTITFSEAVTGLTAADLLVENGTVTKLASNDGGETWLGSFTPNSPVEDASNVITLDNTGVADLAGNAGSGTTDSAKYAIDTQRPTATISLDDTALKVGDTSTVTFTFSEAVTDFTTGDLTVANGTLSPVSSKDGGITWTGTFTPTSDLEDATNVITLDNTGVQDAAGNAGSGTTDSSNYSIDTKRPTATISLDDTALKIGDTSTVTFTFSEAVSGLTNADLTIANGTLSAVSSKDGGVTWTGTFTPTSDLEDAINVITLDSTGIADLAGNVGAGMTDSANYTIDTQRPTATVSLDDTALKIGDTSTVTFTFSEAVTDFTNGDLTVANGTLSPVSSKDGGVTWTGTFTPSSDVEDATNLITLDNAGVQDAAGNAGSGTTDSSNYSIDTQRPTATISLDDTALKIGDTSTVTFTFSEAVTDFTNADLTVANGTLSPVSSKDGGITWTGTFTPTSDLEDATNVITLDNTGVQDAAGNAGSGTTDSSNYSIDTKRPTATISLDDTALKIGDTSTVTFTFSEAVSGLTNADLTIANGTLSSVSSKDGGVTWTGTFTPTSDVENATNLITLDNTGVQDAAGNAGGGTIGSANYAIDTRLPSAPGGLDLTVDSDTGASNTDDYTGDNTPTIAGSAEPRSVVTVFDSNGTTVLGSVTVGDSGTWSITTSPLADGVHNLRAQAVDSAGNPGPFSSAFPITIDTNDDGDNVNTETVVRNGDFNQDGIQDSEQSNVAAFPLSSVEEFKKGIRADAKSFGALLVGETGITSDQSRVNLDPGAKLTGVNLLDIDQTRETYGREIASQVTAIGTDPALSGVLDFTVTTKTEGGTLIDIDPIRPGLQTQVVLDLPGGIEGDTYYKIGKETADGPVHLYAFMASGEHNDGARFVDLNGDGKADRIVITFTDGARGDDDLTVNGIISDPGFVAANRLIPDGKTLVGDANRSHAQRDRLTGTDLADHISGLGKADRLYGLAGDDDLKGGRGRDRLFGGDGYDSLTGGTGNDRLYGDNGNDRLFGDTGRDRLYGGNGDDYLEGGTGRDRLFGDDGNDVLIGNTRNDRLFGGAGNDGMVGGQGRDLYIYRADLLGHGDVTAGAHDKITETSPVNFLDFNSAMERLLKIDGQSLASLDHRQTLGTQISANSNIAFDSANHLLQIDVNGDGVFNAEQDFRIELIGVNRVAYLADKDMLQLLG